jgi:hypothetical protein
VCCGLIGDTKKHENDPRQQVEDGAYLMESRRIEGWKCPNDGHEQRPERAGEKNGCCSSGTGAPARSGALCAALSGRSRELAPPNNAVAPDSARFNSLAGEPRC